MGFRTWVRCRLIHLDQTLLDRVTFLSIEKTSIVFKYVEKRILYQSDFQRVKILLKFQFLINDEERFFSNLMFNQIFLRSHISLLYSPCNSYLSSISDHRIKSCLHVAISHHNMTVIHHQYPIYKEGNGKQKIKETEHQ